MSFNRRRFLEVTLLGATALNIPISKFLKAKKEAAVSRTIPSKGVVIDTNVSIFQWPFRKLKYADTKTLVDKLQKHGIREAWTGSYEALFHKNIDGVNARLAEACQQEGEGLLIPFGTVNPRWPDWQEDLRRCDEDYGMAGIRLYPGYQNYKLDLPEFTELLRQSSERGMIVQIAIDQEDERMQHPKVEIPAVDVSPLPAAMAEAPGVKVQLLNPFRHVRGERLRMMIEQTDVLFGTSNLDGTGSLERILAGKHWYLRDLSISTDRLMVGSHMPFRPLENVLFQLIESELSQLDATAIMAGNADRLIGNV